MRDRAGHLTPDLLTPDLLTEIAERYGTPSYVYDLDTVDVQVAQLRSAFPATDLLYAVKANPCGAVLQRLAAGGLGAEVITEGELARARRAGVPEARILLGGPRQDAPLIEAARGVGWVSLDSPSQWRLWKARGALEGDAPRFLLRLNPGLDPRTHEHLATGAATSKFGMPLETITELGAELGRRLAGFHIHIGSQVSELAAYGEIFAQVETLLRRFPHATTLDLGGGFAVPGFPLPEFAERVHAFLATSGVQQLMLEPGRFLVAESGVLLTRVLHVKEGSVRHVITDAGMADLLRPALYGAQHPIRVVSPSPPEGSPEPSQAADIDGPLCENADRLARGVPFPEVAPGALLVVEQAGAYGFGMASNYASSLRPAEVVLEAGEARLARRRETPEDLLRLEV